VRDLQADRSPAELDRTLAQYLKPDLLLIDDMGVKSLPWSMTIILPHQ
jgi:hypothetical protein